MNIITSTLILSLIFIAIYGLTGCSSGGGGGTAATPHSITVLPTDPTIHVGATQQFTARGTYSDGTSADITAQVQFTSSNTNVITIASDGLGTAKAAGKATITATYPDTNISGSILVTATDANLTMITVYPQNDASYPFRIPLVRGDNYFSPNPPPPTTPTTFKFMAMGMYDDGSSSDVTTQVTWSTGNAGVMTIDNIKFRGPGTAVGVGTTTITATMPSSSVAPGTTKIKVVNAIFDGNNTILNSAKFIEPLPIPAVVQPDTPGGNIYTMSMEQVMQQVLPIGTYPKTTVWGYGHPGSCTYPGPTFLQTENSPITVTWNNNLPSTLIMPQDFTIMGNPIMMLMMPQNRAVVHLHGGNVPASNDGTPEQWYTPGLAQKGNYFETNVYNWPNAQQPATLWYHDHAMGTTRLTVYAGLVGFYIITNAAEAALNLPSGSQMAGIVFQDRDFYDDGSLRYPIDSWGGIQPSIRPEHFGNVIVVNGKAWPYMNVQADHKYRFRLLNGSNARFYRVRFHDDAGAVDLPFQQIGTDKGLMDAPLTMNSLVISPGERCDVVVDFTGIDVGNTVTVTNDAATPFDPSQPSLDPNDPCARLMRFNVVASTDTDTSTVPADLRAGNHIPIVNPVTAAKTRTLTLVEIMDIYGRMLPTLDGKRFTDPVTENPQNNTTEVWKILNLTPDTHPIHLHLVNFQVVQRRPFDVATYLATGVVNYTGPAVGPATNELLKDTIQMNPGEETSIIMNFNSYTGRYVWHCHILEHEEYDMMRYMIVDP